jgi:hypothetical protein
VVYQLLSWLGRTSGISPKIMEPPPGRHGTYFYIIGSSESVHETFSDVKNHARDKLMHMKFMAKFLEDTNQGTPFEQDSCDFSFFGNIGAPLMATFTILG